jgi:hypothetical protein
MSQLNVLFPDRKLSLAAGEVTVRPFPFKHWAKAAAIIAKYAGQFQMDEGKFMQNLSQFVTQGGDDVVEVMLLSIDRDRAFVDNLSGEDGFSLLTEVLEVNADFFTKKILPMGDRLKRMRSPGVALLPS